MIKSRPALQNPPSNLKISGGELVSNHPFKISVISLDNVTKECSILVNLHSHVLASQDVLDKVEVLGKNLKLSFPYGSKVWFEILFDRDRNPVVGFVRVGNKWAAKTKNSSGVLQDVYPNCEEFISKDDLVAKLADLDVLISYVDELKTKSAEELLFQKNNGIITQSQYQVLTANSEPAFARYKTILQNYKTELPKFFEAAPSASWKKLFRLYYLIGYSTKDMSGAVPGSIAYFSNEGSSTTPDVPQAVKPSSYKVIQCANSDLLLQDSWYNNSYPSKILVPFGRAVHTFYDGQETEEDKNT